MDMRLLLELIKQAKELTRRKTISAEILMKKLTKEVQTKEKGEQLEETLLGASQTKRYVIVQYLGSTETVTFLSCSSTQ